MKSTDLAWLAGMMDGEGCVGLYEYTTTKGYETRVIRGMVTVVNTHEPTMDKVAEIYDELGAVYYRRKVEHPKNPTWKNSFTIVVQNREGMTVVLEAILPYLVTKKEQAELCLQYLRRPKFSKINEEERGLLGRVQLLNRKGVPVG